MKLPLLAMLGMLVSGCTIRYVPAPQQVVQPAPSSAYIQYHYVYTNHRWSRRVGPPPAGSRYTRHPHHPRTVIVHRSTSTRSVHSHSTRYVSKPKPRPSNTTRRSTAHRHTKNCRHHTHRSTRRR